MLLFGCWAASVTVASSGGVSTVANAAAAAARTFFASTDAVSFPASSARNTRPLAIAFGGVFSGHYFNFPFFDGIASVLIGLLLSAVALFLGYESKGLLIGEAVDKETLRGIRQIAEAEPTVEKTLKILTIYFGAKDVLLTLELQFAKDVTAPELRTAIRDRTKATTTFGYGPRYLHSTGQYHKGGPAQGLFIELIADAEDLPVPGEEFSFNQLKHAQALGDLRTLLAHGLPACQLTLDGDPAAAIRAITKELFD